LILRSYKSFFVFWLIKAIEPESPPAKAKRSLLYEVKSLDRLVKESAVFEKAPPEIPLTLSSLFASKS